jgi:hypothetical protein
VMIEAAPNTEARTIVVCLIDVYGLRMGRTIVRETIAQATPPIAPPSRDRVLCAVGSGERSGEFLVSDFVSSGTMLRELEPRNSKPETCFIMNNVG